jgi:hypothetical protein
MKGNFNGNLKDAILYMIETGTDCCEVTNTVNGFSVTVALAITKITNGDEILYDAGDEDNCEFDLYNEDGEFIS